MNNAKIKSFFEKDNLLETLKNNGIWIVGCSLYAIAVNSFVVPNDIAQSGVTGTENRWLKKTASPVTPL